MCRFALFTSRLRRGMFFRELLSFSPYASRRSLAYDNAFSSSHARAANTTFDRRHVDRHVM